VAGFGPAAGQRLPVIEGAEEAVQNNQRLTLALFAVVK
jgi:hypothetical protein